MAFDPALDTPGIDPEQATAHEAFRTVKLFDLGQAPTVIQDAIRPIARVHISTVDGCAIWGVTVGLYEWQDAAEEWALHRWLRESGAGAGESVLLQCDDIESEPE